MSGTAAGNGRVSVLSPNIIFCVTGEDRLLCYINCWSCTVGYFLLGMQSCIITEMHTNRLIRKGIKNATFSLVHCRLQLVICVGKRPQSQLLKAGETGILLCLCKES